MNEIEEICEKCEKPKIRYYRDYCPRCEKPEIKISYSLNLLECLYHIQTTSHPGFKDKFWDYLINNHNVSNDSIIELYNEDSDIDPLVKELFEKMGLKFEKYMNFEISW